MVVEFIDPVVNDNRKHMHLRERSIAIRNFFSVFGLSLFAIGHTGGFLTFFTSSKTKCPNAPVKTRAHKSDVKVPDFLTMVYLLVHGNDKSRPYYTPNLTKVPSIFFDVFIFYNIFYFFCKLLGCPLMTFLLPFINFTLYKLL
ncbi:MAG: hypothetical protein CM15mV139_370 [Caudoviricetes sp.]|nr:MAG: hypothetical protein CM15mV139_370 [Caudoviricetes sp.]